MSGTLALAESVKPEVKTRPESQSMTQAIKSNVSHTVLVDGLVFVAPVPYGSRCPQWFDLAMQYFPLSEWDTIDFLLSRESRCDLQAFNPHDSNGKPSYSLFQINAFWCSPNKNYATGFLQEHGILATCAELFDPVTQFRAARAIYVEGLVRHGKGWRSWGSYPETR